ncbi:MAG: thymidine phosphorylase, partial [bacterium]
MTSYFKSRKLDVSAGDPLIVLMNEKDAIEEGFHIGSKAMLCWKDVCLYVTVDFTDSVVDPGELGMFSEVWEKYRIPSHDMVSLTLSKPPESLEYIRKKIQGHKLNFEEIKKIMEDVSSRSLSTIEITYFASTYYNPGFDDEELFFLTKAMAETGTVFDFKKGNESIVIADKHSIGGVPAKGVTPVLVPIIASCGLVIPNTSSRSITTPAGTSDMLEVIMPVILNKEKILDVVSKHGGCLVWGGGIDLAPADDILINIERPLRIESVDKFLVSIIAKKIPMQITKLLIDIPYGEGAKIHSFEEVNEVESHFERLCDMFNIDVEIYKREVFGPDGNGVGPTLEIRDVLRILDRHQDRPKALEQLIVDMSGRLLELSGVAKQGEGKALAMSKLENGEAKKKFWDIALEQGAQKELGSEDLQIAEYTFDVKAEKSGVVSRIGIKQTIDIARALGAPFMKESGIYFHKLVGDNVK